MRIHVTNKSENVCFVRRWSTARFLNLRFKRAFPSRCRRRRRRRMRIKCNTHKHIHIQSRRLLHWFICKREINTGSCTFAATLINSHMSSFFAIPQSRNGKVSERASEGTRERERADSMNEKDRVKFKIQKANLTEYVIVTRCAGNFKLASSTHNVRARTTEQARSRVSTHFTWFQPKWEKMGVCGGSIVLRCSSFFPSPLWFWFRFFSAAAFVPSVKIFHKILHLEYDISYSHFSVVALLTPLLLLPLLFHVKNYICMHICVFFHFHAYEYKFVVTAHP